MKNACCLLPTFSLSFISCSLDPGEGFNVTIEHVGDDLGHGSGLVHLLEVPPNLGETKNYHRDDILDVGK